MKHVPASLKLRTWAPQLAMVAIATAAGTAIAAISSPIARAPLTVLCLLSGLVCCVTSISKIAYIDTEGWPEFEKKCERCGRLEGEVAKLNRDRDELRAALLALEPPK